MLVLGRDDFFFAPEIKTAVIVQRHDTRRRQLRVFWNQYERGDPYIRRGIEINFFTDVVALVHLLDHFGPGSARRGRVVQQFEQFSTRLAFPTPQILETRVQEREREVGLDGLALDERKKRADIGVGFRNVRRL